MIETRRWCPPHQHVSVRSKSRTSVADLGQHIGQFQLDQLVSAAAAGRCLRSSFRTDGMPAESAAPSVSGDVVTRLAAQGNGPFRPLTSGMRFSGTNAPSIMIDSSSRRVHLIIGVSRNRAFAQRKPRMTPSKFAQTTAISATGALRSTFFEPAAATAIKPYKA